jgi:hypothetical protein
LDHSMPHLRKAARNPETTMGPKRRDASMNPRDTTYIVASFASPSGNLPTPKSISGMTPSVPARAPREFCVIFAHVNLCACIPPPLLLPLSSLPPSQITTTLLEAGMTCVSAPPVCLALNLKHADRELQCAQIAMRHGSLPRSSSVPQIAMIHGGALRKTVKDPKVRYTRCSKMEHVSRYMHKYLQRGRPVHTLLTFWHTVDA